MERNLDRKTLSFGKGMTNVPSDLLSDDTELALSHDFIYKDGEMKPIQKMEQVGSIGGKVMHVHKMADFENFIAYDEFEENGTITWYKRSDLRTKAGRFTNIGNVTDIKSVGNTLVVATDKHIRYYLYKGGSYKDLGSELPIPHFYPYFEHKTSGWDAYKCELAEIVDGEDMHAWYDQEGNFIGFFNTAPTPPEDEREQYVQGEYCYVHKIKKDRETDYLNAVQGCIMKGIDGEKEKNRFCFPFFIRYALKLYDGTYARISAPIVCYPSISRNCNFYNSSANSKNCDFYFVPYSAKLKYAASISEMGNWTDIVKEITVFASDEVMPYYDIDSKHTSDWKLFVGETKHLGDGFDKIYFNTLGEEKAYEDIISNHSVIIPRYKSESEIIEELVSKTQFYKLASLKVTNKEDINVTFDENKDLPLKRNVVGALTSQEQLRNDDYYGWAHLYAKKMFPYNNRLNVFGLKRFPFEGFNNFLATKKQDDLKATYYVHIVSQSMDAWVKSEESNIVNESTLTGWLYYPDPNATEVIIHLQGKNIDRKIKISLNTHAMLNGAYSFENLPTEETTSAVDSREGITLPDVDEDAHETLNSQIFTSVVNNPFVFEASGDNTIGTGGILGIVSNTDAISQGQFGQYPLLVFTDEGIYAMGVNSEGLYSNIYPISREVCNNADSITPTDKLIYFTSEKGLMATTGGQVVCVSNALSGGRNRLLPESILPFKKFLESCLIAYDYKESLLRIFNTSTNYHYVYNMIDKTFANASNHSGGRVFCRNIVNNYPDNMVQFTDSSVYSLTSIPRREDDGNSYDGILKTRPLKLGGSTLLKSMRGLHHLFDSDTGSIKVSLYGSNNGKVWQKLTSLMGKPWKYFRLEYTLNGFSATDSFAGSIVEVQTRRDDKIR